MDLVSEEIYDVTFIGVGKDQYYQDIGDMIDGNVISWVEDSQNDNYPVWSSWNAYQRAIYFLNRDGSVDTTFNFTPYNENQGNYDIIFNLIMELRGYNNNSIEIEYFSGWNMVGLPIIVNDNNYQYLFPTSVSGSLYSFSGSYTQENTLDVGQGYWIRLSDIAINNFYGENILLLELSLVEGWNLISGTTVAVLVGDIIDNNQIIIGGTIFGFEDFYQNANSLNPGRAYWIRATENGIIILTTE